MNAPAIGDYGLIGDTRTAALCSRWGSIDWLCVPRFDSEPIFGRLLAGMAGGSFSIAADDVREVWRRYQDGSAVLATTWRTDGGEAELVEGMAVDVTGALLPQTALVRRIRCHAGRVAVRLCYDPRRGLPGKQPRSQRRHGGLISTWGSLAVCLQSWPDLQIVPGREETIVLDSGDSLTFVLSAADKAPAVLLSPDSVSRLLDSTTAWWRTWSGHVGYEGKFRESVLRSFITLRLLTYSPSGAPVAAPTTSLPEVIGGGRNWDYRFSWPRDASIGLAAFLSVDMDEEAHSFLHWLLHASRLTRPRLDVLYTMDGKQVVRERELFDVPGYRGSRPVRIGNAARGQHQLDVYGWVLDAAWLLVAAGRRLHGEIWRALGGFADFVASSWRKPDAGIWEVRQEPDHFVHSKLMGWVALDRAVRISHTHPVRPARLRRWTTQRQSLAESIRTDGFDDARNCYVRSYGSKELDAALLLLPVLDFEDPGSPRLRGTVQAIRSELHAGDGLLYRYRPLIDQLEGVEGAFLPCSFWLVQALARLGDVDEATEIFGQLLGLSNDVGLLPEEIDPATKGHLGNFPQAFTHATAIQAALALEAGYPGERKVPRSAP